MMMCYLRSVLSVLVKDIYFLAQYISLSFFLSDSSLACFDERSPRNTDAFRFSCFLIFNIFLISSLCVSLSIFFLKKGNAALQAPSLFNIFISLKGGAAGKLAERRLAGQSFHPRRRSHSADIWTVYPTCLPQDQI